MRRRPTSASRTQFLEIELLLEPGERRKLQRQRDGEPGFAEDEGEGEG